MKNRLWIIPLGALALGLAACSSDDSAKKVEELEKEIAILEAKIELMEDKQLIDEAIHDREVVVREAIITQPAVITHEPIVLDPEAYKAVQGKSSERVARYYFDTIRTVCSMDTSLALLIPQSTEPGLSPNERAELKIKIAKLEKDRNDAKALSLEVERGMREADRRDGTQYRVILNRYQQEYNSRREALKIQMLNSSGSGLSAKEQMLHDEFKEIRNANFEQAIAIGKSSMAEG